jgi:PAS domain S-box-containing protein
VFHHRGTATPAADRPVPPGDHAGFWELATDLFATTGDDGRLRSLNPAWERVLGRSLDALGAAPLLSFVHPGDAAATAALLAHGDPIDGHESRWRRGDGAYRTLSLSGRRDDGVWRLVGRDVTGRREERTLLRDAERIIRFINWQWHVRDDRVTTGDGTDTRLGGLAEMLAVVAPEDRPAVAATFAALRNGTQTSAAMEHRVLGEDGQRRWLDSHCHVVAGADGRPGIVRGTSQDITERVAAREQLRAAGDFWQDTMDSLQTQVAVIDADGRVLAVNDAWRRFEAGSGSGDGLLGEPYFGERTTSLDPAGPQARAGITAVLDGRVPGFSMEYGDDARCFELQATRFSGTGPVSVVIARHDVTERRAMEREALKQASLLDVIDVAVVATDGAGEVTHWNHGAEVLYGWSRDEARGRRAAELIVPRDAPAAATVISDLRTAGRWEGRMTVQRKDGSTFPAHIRDTVVVDDDGRATGMIGVSLDMTAADAAEQSLTAARNHLAAVTDSMGEGLFALDGGGRVTLMNQAAEAMLGWSPRRMCGLVLHDVVHYRRPGGAPLAAIDSPIETTLRDGATVRVDDEVFVRRDGTELAVAYTAAPLVTSDGADGCVVVFTDATARRAEQAALRRELAGLSWVARVQDALREERFVLHAQPILDLRSGEIVQQELLLRMRGPAGEIVGPAEFLQIAEDHQLIGDIDRWVIGEAVRLAAGGMPVELNVSGRSISDPSLLTHIERCLEESGADPALLVFEITETAVVHDEAAGRWFAERVHQLGCKLALDDFGTGYGGFTYLKQLPVDYLKIDIEFVGDLLTSTASRHVVEAVITLAAGFGLQTVAEGVEDAETLALLKELGVDFAQGYHIARPGPLPGADRTDDPRT